MFDKKSMPKDFNQYCKENDISTKASSVSDFPVTPTEVGRKRHVELYRAVQAQSSGFPYNPYHQDAMYYGCPLAHYKWSWKLNKAVRV